MGMKSESDEAIKILNEIIEEGWLISDMEKCTAIDACEFAIDRIQKYQKIEQILDDCDLEAWEILEKIKEVIKVE